jgi:hypothetical protein
MDRVKADPRLVAAKAAEAARALREAFDQGSPFPDAARALLARRALEPAAPALYLPEAFGDAFAVHPAECLIFGGWSPDGAGEIDDARLERSLTETVIEFSTDSELVHRLIARAYTAHAREEGGERYFTIERRANASEAMRVEPLQTHGRTLVIRYRRTGAYMEAPGLQRLALHAIVHGLLEHAYDGNVDQISWHDLAHGRTQAEPYT